MAKNFEAENVALVDPAAVRADAAANIAALGGSASRTNIATGRQGTQAGFRDLMQGGLAFVNPAGAEAIRLFEAQNRVSPNDLKEQARLRAIVSSGTNANGKPLTAKQIAAAQAKLNALTTRIDTRQQRVADFKQQTIAGSPNAGDVMRQADPSTYANIDRAQGIADQMGSMTDAGRRFMGALGQGYQAANIGSRDVTAAQAAGVGNIAAGQVGGGTLGQSLMDRALAGVARGGRLSDQEGRDAVQSARQAFAARGLATSGAAIGAELMNRDRFTRQRELQDLEIARNVQDQDLQRQQMNQNRSLTADEANQRTGMLMNQFNTGELNRVGMFNSEQGLRGQIANEESRRLGNQMNIGMLGDATNYEQGLQDRGLGASLQMAGVQQQANPLMRALMFDPYGTRGSGTQALGPGTQLAGGVMDANTQIGMFNANANNWAKASNMYGQYGNQQSGMGTAGNIGMGALSGAAAMAPTGNPYLIGGGAVVGGMSGLFGR